MHGYGIKSLKHRIFVTHYYKNTHSLFSSLHASYIDNYDNRWAPPDGGKDLSTKAAYINSYPAPQPIKALWPNFNQQESPRKI